MCEDFDVIKPKPQTILAINCNPNSFYMLVINGFTPFPYAVGLAVQQAHAATLGEVVDSLCPEIATPLAKNKILQQAIAAIKDEVVGKCPPQ